MDVTSKAMYVYYWCKIFQIAEFPLFIILKNIVLLYCKKGERLDNFYNTSSTTPTHSFLLNFGFSFYDLFFM